MKVQFKAVCWLVADVEEDNEQEFLDLVKEGEIESIEDINLYIDKSSKGFYGAPELIEPEKIDVTDDEFQSLI